MSVFIIAEAGVNHNGKLNLALQLIDAAVEAGADAVKFQTFKADNLVTKTASKAIYQQRVASVDETQLEMLRRLELPYETHFDLVAHCEKRGIQFISTAFDFESLDFLIKDIRLRTLKIPSGEITNGPFLLAHANTKCDMILSTGMATLGEVESALSVIAFGLTIDSEPSHAMFRAAYASKKGQKALKNKVTLLHCTSEYPAPPQDINLNAMVTMCNAFGLKTGYSDHSLGITIPTAATAMGAFVIEKHLTLDNGMEGPDHRASLNPKEFSEMVESIRTVELAMGTGVKVPMPSEIKNRDIVRKVVVAACDIAVGERFTEQNLDVKRAGSGISPMEYWDLIGKCCRNVFKAGDVLR